MTVEHWEAYYRGGAIATCPMGPGTGYTLELHDLWFAFFASLADGSSVLDLGIGEVSGEVVHTKDVSVDEPNYRKSMAATSLALDLDGRDPNLPALAASLDVPCIAPLASGDQAILWPDLCPAGLDEVIAAKLGRRILSDQVFAADCCSVARQRLLYLAISTPERKMKTSTSKK